MKVFLTLLLIVLLLIGIFGTVYAYKSYYRASIAILTTAAIQAQLIPGHEGDARVGGMILLASTLKTQRNDIYKNRILLLDAGNSLFEDIAHIEFSRKMPQYLKEMGFDAITLGFRDFSVVREVDWKTSPPVLACNVEVDRDEQAKLPQFLPSKLFVIRRKRIAVIGVVDPDTASYQDAEHMKGIHIADSRQTQEKIQAEVNRWIKGKVDFIVLLSSALKPSLNKTFAENVKHLNLILGIQALGEQSVARINPPIVTAASGGRTIGVAHANSTADGRGTNLEARSEIDVNSEQFESDAAFTERARRYWIDSISNSQDEHVIGSVKDAVKGVPLKVDDPLLLYHPYWSYFESPMLRLVADAMREQYPKWEVENHLPSENIDIAFINGGTLEDGLPPNNPGGIVTLSMLRRALPYNNKVVKIYLNKQQILAVLNSQGMRDRGLIGVSGLDYVWNYNTGRVDEATLKIESPRGKKMAFTDRQYAVAVPDFVLKGGDGYMKDKSFDNVRNQIKNQINQSANYPTMVDLLREYVYSKSPIPTPATPRGQFLR